MLVLLGLFPALTQAAPPAETDLAPALEGPDDAKPMPDTSAGPVICKAGLYLRTVHVDEVSERFEAQFYWWLRVDGIDPTRDYTFVRDVEVVNSDGSFEITQEVLDEERRYYYVSGTAKIEIPYKAKYERFPFDEQVLDVAIENQAANDEVVRYVADDLDRPLNDVEGHGIEFLNGDEFYVVGLAHRDEVASYRSRFGDPDIQGFDDYSRMVFSIRVTRDPWGVLIKIALPLFIVLFLSYLVFFIPDEEIGTASSLTVTSLIAAIAFQWTIDDALPQVSYLTLIDKLFYVVYLFVFYAMTQTILTFNLSQGGERQRAFSGALERWSRYAFPVGFVASVALLMYFNRF